MVVGVGGGIGAGYAIGHSQNNHPTPVLALSASISNNNLKIGTEGTATLSVTEINADGWTEPAVTVPTGLTASGSWTVSGLTGTTTISLSSGSSLVAGSYTIAISANGASIDQNVSVAPATPTPALSASISNNNLQLGTTGTATLSVTEINTTD
jgi:hypothetical protein